MQIHKIFEGDYKTYKIRKEANTPPVKSPLIRCDFGLTVTRQAWSWISQT